MSSIGFVGTTTFRPPSQPSPSPTSNAAPTTPAAPRRSRRSSAASNVNPRLSIIEEDKPHHSPPPDSPPSALLSRAHNRPWSRRFLSEPPRYSIDKHPPTYSFHDTEGGSGPPDDTEGVKHEKLAQLRNKKFIARRGGWKRICLILLLVLLCLVGLVVGLAVGLSKHNNDNDSSSSSSSSPSTTDPSLPSGPFPIGSWTFTTFLTNTSTACLSSTASSASTWICPPSNIAYTQSASQSEAQFQWIINSTTTTTTTSSSSSSSSNSDDEKSNTNTTLQISSAPNPFSIVFPPTPLTLIAAGTQDERYTFTVTNLQKITYPQNNVKCFFNTTSLTANLYTRRAQRLSSSSSSSSSSAAAAAPSASSSSSSSAGGNGDGQTAAYAMWPHAVDALQDVGAGQGIPDCYAWNNGLVGRRITDGVGAGAEKSNSGGCGCGWSNY